MCQNVILPGKSFIGSSYNNTKNAMYVLDIFQAALFFFENICQHVFDRIIPNKKRIFIEIRIFSIEKFTADKYVS